MADQDKKGVQLYYSPRILPDVLDDNDNNDDHDQKTNVKYIKRFIHSIIRREQDKFHELLPKVDVNANASTNKWTPLIWAVQKDRIYYIQQMFNSNQIIDFANHIDQKTKRNVLHFAAEKGNLKLLMLFLLHDKKQQNIHKNPIIKLNINYQDREQCTPLYRAAKNGDPLLIKALLQYNADPNITNRDGVSPLLIASHKGHTDAVKVLISDQRLDINLADDRGRTPLMCSCAEDHYQIAKMLLTFDNIDFNAIDYQNFSWNCLMWCVYRKNEKMLSLLLDNDEHKNVNAYKVNYFYQNYDKLTVLDMCRKQKLPKNIEDKLRSKYHSIIYPAIVHSNLIVDFKIPVAVVSVLMVFTY